MNKITLPFLPMDDIANYLIEYRDFGTKTIIDNAILGNNSNLAVVPDPNDRTTVENSLKLGGILAEDYLTKEEAEKVTSAITGLSAVMQKEDLNLRDELYQLKAELGKGGYISQQQVYEGFYDSFKKNYKKYLGKICGIESSIISETTTLTIDDISKLYEFEVGHYFVINRDDSDEFDIVKITAVSDTGVITFFPSSSILNDKDNVSLYGSKGQYSRNAFSFSKTDNDVTAGSKVRYHMQNDDTSTKMLTINKTNTGYGCLFKVPNNVTTDGIAALTEFTVTAKSTGSPGDLICYLLSDTSVLENGNFKCKFKDIEDADNKGFLIAKSNGINYNDVTTEKQISFNFFDPTTGEYPHIEDKKYLFIIECIDSDDDNYWDIKFSYYEEEEGATDLERYNKSYKYEKVQLSIDNPDDETFNNAIMSIDDIDKYDLMFIMKTKELVPCQEYGYTEGIYTAHYVLPNPIDVSKFRLTMQIEREGTYYISEMNEDYTEFIVKKEDSSSYSDTDLRFSLGEKIIIGNQIAEIRSCSGNKITVASPVNIDYRTEMFYTKNNEVRIPVYRMNYDVYLKAKTVDWTDFNVDTKQFNATNITEIPVKLSLTNVIPNNDNKISRVSDRLIFECNLKEDEIVLANEFKVQAIWKSPFTYDEINDSNNLNDGFNELIGRIYTFVVSSNEIY